MLVRRPARRAVFDSRSWAEVRWTYGHAIDGAAGRVADCRHDGRGDRDAWKLADALRTQRGLGLVLLDQGGQHYGHVESGRDQVAGERRVLHQTAFDNDLLHHRE